MITILANIPLKRELKLFGHSSVAPKLIGGLISVRYIMREFSDVVSILHELHTCIFYPLDTIIRTAA